MTCHDYKDIMMGYLDNELSNEQRRQFEEHLTGCSECKAELKRLRGRCRPEKKERAGA